MMSQSSDFSAFRELGSSRQSILGEIRCDLRELGEGGSEVFMISAAMVSGSGRLALSSRISNVKCLDATPFSS
jgi:hypothetical protein